MTSAHYSCCVPHCKPSSAKEVQFHQFPRDEGMKQIWVQKINRPNWNPAKKSKVCSKHFTPECYLLNPTIAIAVGMSRGALRLRADAIPTLGLFLLDDRNLDASEGSTSQQRLSSPSTSTGTSSAYVPLSSPSTSTQVRPTSSTRIPVVTTNTLPKVEPGSASSSIAQGPTPVLPSVLNSQASIVNQEGYPGLPQITEISWGTAVPGQPNTTTTSWDYILPTSGTAEGIQPRTRDIGIQVELITTETKNVIHNRDWEDSLQPSQTSRQTCNSTSSQYDRVDDSPLQSQSTSSREPMEEQGISSSEKSVKTQRVFLVFEAMLLQLFTFCRKCFAGCSASVSSSCISVVIVRTRCSNGHTLKWESQPPKKSIGFIQLLQKEVNRLRSELHPVREPRTSIEKRLKIEPEFIDVVQLLSLPKPLTCSSLASDCDYVDS